jgi:hypothetical protein
VRTASRRNITLTERRISDDAGGDLEARFYHDFTGSARGMPVIFCASPPREKKLAGASVRKVTQEFCSLVDDYLGPSTRGAFSKTLKIL